MHCSSVLGHTFDFFELVPSVLNYGTLEANKCLTDSAVELDFCVSVFLAVKGQCGDMMLQFLINLSLSHLLKFKDFVMKCYRNYSNST